MAIAVLNEVLADTEKRAALLARLRVGAPAQGADDCWLWMLGKFKSGYGRLSYGHDHVFRTHQVAFAMANGAIPAGMNVLHQCDTPACCNPGHLFLGTQAENMHDMKRKGRMSAPPIHAGEEQHKAKLTREDAIAIKTDPRSCKALAKEYNVWPTTIWCVKTGRTWKEARP